VTAEQTTPAVEPTKRQLEFWAKQGFLHPVGGGRKGRRLTWPPQEKDIARLMVRLAAAGMSHAKAAAVARVSIEQDAEAVQIGPGLILGIDLDEDEP
jgi:hypothetical protein